MRLLAVTLCTSLTWLAAEEGPTRVSDVRFFGSYSNDGGEITTTDRYDDPNIGTISYDAVEADVVYRAGIGGFGTWGSTEGFGAPILGGSFQQMKCSSSEQRNGSGFGDPTNSGTSGPFTTTVNESVDVTANIFSIYAGWAKSIGGFHIEAMVRFGYGTLRGTENDVVLVDPDTNETRVVDFHASNDGHYWEAGGTVGCYYTWKGGFQLGVFAELVHGEGESDISSTQTQSGNVITTTSLSDGSFTEEFEINTIFGGASLGLRF